jgi:4-hydroxybenzoate polyprenyltransferase
VREKILVFSEIVLPWQSFTSVFWLLSGILVSGKNLRFDWSFCLLIVALLSARSLGMCLNRLCDKEIDAKNPRTSSRALACGKVSPKEVILISCAFGALFCLLCYSFPFVGRIMGVWVAFLVCIYSYTKRFTWLCHFVLGAIHGTIPVVGALWLAGTWNIPVLLLSMGAFFSITGTDILYSTLDEDFDRSSNLKSVSACFGNDFAKKGAFLLHMISLLCVAGSLFLVSHTSFVIWVVLSLVFCTIWRFFWKNRLSLSTMFPLSLLFFSCGTFSGVIWRALL